MPDLAREPGWYDDPYGEAVWRWWDGSAWSTATRMATPPEPTPTPPTPPPSSPVEPVETPAAASVAGTASLFVDKDQRRAAVGLTALVVAAIAVVGAAIAFTGSPSDAPAGGVAGDGDRDPPPTDGPDEPVTDDATAGDDEAASEGAEVEGEGEGEGEDVSEADAQGSDPVHVEFDGVCTVEIEPEEFDDLRPWRFDECTSAPVDLRSGDDERWIVVVTSLSGDEFDEGAARERAVSQGFGERVLWSSHYPSLNPDLWVIFDGPFADEPEAATAAEEIGGGAYPRVLSDDDDDRYCLAADGCEGGRGG